MNSVSSRLRGPKIRLHFQGTPVEDLISIQAESPYVSIRSVLHAGLQMYKGTQSTRSSSLNVGSQEGSSASQHYTVSWLQQVLDLDVNVGTLALEDDDILHIACLNTPCTHCNHNSSGSGMFATASTTRNKRERSENEESEASKMVGGALTQEGLALEDGGPLLKHSAHLRPAPSLPNLTITIQYGNTARWLEQATEGERTHEWTAFVRCPWGGTLEHVVTRVHFFLHSTFIDPERVVRNPPFEVSEVGWGQFLLGIHIYFVGCSDPHRVTHPLLLSPPLAPPLPPHIPPHEKPLAHPKQKNDLRLVTYTRTPVLVHTIEEVIIENPPRELKKALHTMYCNRSLQCVGNKPIAGNGLPGEDACVTYVRTLIEGVQNENRLLLENIRQKTRQMYDVGVKIEPLYQ